MGYNYNIRETTQGDKMINDLYTDADLLLTDEKLRDMMIELQYQIDHLEGCLHLNSFQFARTGRDTFKTRLGWMNRIEAEARIAKIKKSINNLNAQYRNYIPRKIDQSLRREKILAGLYVSPEREIIASVRNLSSANKVIRFTNQEYSSYCSPELEDAIEQAEANER